MKQLHVFYANQFFNKTFSIPTILDQRLKEFKSMPLIETRERITNIFFKWLSDKKMCRDTGINPEVASMNESARDFLAQNLAAMYLTSRNGTECYKICDDFAHALKLAPVNVPAKHIDFNDRRMYVELPESLGILPVGHYPGFYVECCKITDAYKAAVNHSDLNDKAYSIQIRFPHDSNPVGPGSHPCALITISLAENENISETIFKRLNQDPNLEPFWKQYSTAAFEYIAKILLYINSGDPDLRHLQPVKQARGLRAFKRRRKNEHGYLMPVTLVGFNYKKPALYSKSETLVSTHPRWQPCGKNREQIKLIWVREHVRHYAQRAVQLQT